MLCAAVYPITLAEMRSYSDDADQLFTGDAHERLKEFLAVHPESGDLIPGTGGVRQLLWPVDGTAEADEAQIVYYFRDLNMPIYLLAVYAPGERAEFDDATCEVVRTLVAEIVEEHSKRWAQAMRQDKRAQVVKSEQ
jgi:hypothetical protein